MKINCKETMALIIDYQERLVPAMNEKEELLFFSKKLIQGLKELQVPFMVTTQYQKGLGHTVEEISELTGDVEYDKTGFSALSNPQVSEGLTKDKKFVVICGMETHICVLQTVLDLLSKGYIPVVVKDCVASRKQEDKVVAIERMKQEGAIITTMESLLFELLEGANHKAFKSISALIK